MSGWVVWVYDQHSHSRLDVPMMMIRLLCTCITVQIHTPRDDREYKREHMYVCTRVYVEGLSGSPGIVVWLEVTTMMTHPWPVRV